MVDTTIVNGGLQTNKHHCGAPHCRSCFPSWKSSSFAQRFLTLGCTATLPQVGTAQEFTRMVDAITKDRKSFGDFMGFNGDSRLL